ncbi:MAG: hypothetical protein EOP66_10265 [Sphingomonas sp.]|nr:MAG: hypothetical protein EOP66_10265 [Sphingomonas sp.]
MASDPDSASTTSAETSSAKTAENLLSVRGLRTEVFPSEIFDEHAWTMLLHLFITQAKRDTVTEPDLIALTATPTAVGQRWLAHLVADAQIEPYADGDAIMLTPSAVDRMQAFLSKASAIHRTDATP